METLRKLRKGKACSGFGIHFNVVACFEKLAKVENCCCMVRLEAIHADLNALDIENVEKELDKLKLLEPMVDKSSEKFLKLAEQQEACDSRGDLQCVILE